MQYTKGYKYITKQDAENAVALCNQYYGIPEQTDDTTQNWCMYQVAELNTPIFWYISLDESLIVVLGKPTEFEVIYEDLSE
jgi:hypothetical protein